MLRYESSLSSRLISGLRLLLVLVALSGVVSTTTGCSWFKKKKKPVTEVTPPAPQDMSATDTAPAAPAGDSIEDPNRISGEPIPFPELSVILFDYDRSDIRADQLDKIDGNLKYLLANPGDKVLIEGHCDERGTVEYNFSLGERRAAAVRDYYLKGGVPAERVAIISKGEEEPVAIGHDESAWSQNRRAAFKKLRQ